MHVEIGVWCVYGDFESVCVCMCCVCVVCVSVSVRRCLSVCVLCVCVRSFCWDQINYSASITHHQIHSNV